MLFLCFEILKDMIKSGVPTLVGPHPALVKSATGRGVWTLETASPQQFMP